MHVSSADGCVYAGQLKKFYCDVDTLHCRKCRPLHLVSISLNLYTILTVHTLSILYTCTLFHRFNHSLSFFTQIAYKLVLLQLTRTSIHASIHQSIYPSIQESNNPSIYLYPSFLPYFFLSFFRYLNLFCLSYSLPIHPSMHLSIHQSIYPSIHPSMHLSIYVSLSFFPYFFLSFSKHQKTFCLH